MKRLLFQVVMVSVVLLAAESARAGGFLVTVEAPTVQNTTATFSLSGVETFDSQPLSSDIGTSSFTTDFGTAGVITGNYSGVTIVPADEYGGAGGTGNYATDYNNTPYSLTLSTTNPAGIDYFGLWISAMDVPNDINIYSGGNLVESFDTADLLAFVAGNPSYFGNPNGNVGGPDNDPTEPFAFVNFFDTTGTFDTVTFSSAENTFESDNHTVGIYTTTSGTAFETPEPASLALLLAGGLGLVAARRRLRA